MREVKKRAWGGKKNRRPKSRFGFCKTLGKNSNIVQQSFFFSLFVCAQLPSVFHFSSWVKVYKKYIFLIFWQLFILIPVTPISEELSFSLFVQWHFPFSLSCKITETENTSICISFKVPQETRTRIFFSFSPTDGWTVEILSSRKKEYPRIYQRLWRIRVKMRKWERKKTTWRVPPSPLPSLLLSLRVSHCNAFGWFLLHPFLCSFISSCLSWFGPLLISNIIQLQQHQQRKRRRNKTFCQQKISLLSSLLFSGSVFRGEGQAGRIERERDSRVSLSFVILGILSYRDQYWAAGLDGRQETDDRRRKERRYRRKDKKTKEEKRDEKSAADTERTGPSKFSLKFLPQSLFRLYYYTLLSTV